MLKIKVKASDIGCNFEIKDEKGSPRKRAKEAKYAIESLVEYVKSLDRTLHEELTRALLEDLSWLRLDEDSSFEAKTVVVKGDKTNG